jgi:HEAT repeat protein
MGSKIRFVALLPLVFALCGCRAKAPYDGKSVAELERLLRNPDPAKQVQGAFGLSRLGAKAQPAVPALIEALKKDALVRQNAALALGRIGPEAKDAVPALIDALRDSDWTVRRQAALALEQIGPEARQAVPALEKLTHDPDKLVRKAAQEALTQLHPRVTGDKKKQHP